MASIVAMRDGLKANLQTISGLRVTEYIRGTIVTPAAVITPGDGGRGRQAVNYDMTMGRGSDSFLYTIIVLVSLINERSSTDQLDAYLAGSGATSVKAAVESDETLGGAADFVRVTGVHNYGTIDYGGQTYMGAEFVVEVVSSVA